MRVGLHFGIRRRIALPILLLTSFLHPALRCAWVEPWTSTLSIVLTSAGPRVSTLAQATTRCYLPVDAPSLSRRRLRLYLPRLSPAAATHQRARRAGRLGLWPYD